MKTFLTRKFIAFLTILACLMAIFFFLMQKLNLNQSVAIASTIVHGKPVGLAPNFAKITDIPARKTAFFSYLFPGIEWENYRIATERAKLEQMKKELADNRSTTDNIATAKRLGLSYGLPLPESGLSEAWLTEMLIRVNYLPPALVMTQAAIESAWGTSRFAVQANNFFGQWCFVKGCGLVPKQRSKGMIHEVQSFDNVQQAIHGYFMNVNRHKAYAELRKIRQQRATDDLDLLSVTTALALADGLVRYSERGETYVKEVKSAINFNASYIPVSDISVKLIPSN